MAYTRVKVGLSEAVLAEVDALRGDVPRERYLRRVIEDHVGGVPRPRPHDPPGAVGETVQRAKALVRAPEPKPSKAPPDNHREFLEQRGPKEQPVTHKFEAVSKYDPRCKHCNQRERTH